MASHSRFLICIVLLLVFVFPLSHLRAEEESGGKAEPTATQEGEGKAKKKEGGEAEGGSKSKGDSDVSGGRFAGDPVYVHLAPMVLPIITENGAEQLITLIIDVEVKDFDVADNMHTNMPRIRDALMRYLYGGLGEGSLRNGKLVNVTRIKAKATLAINEVVGADGVRNVLIQGIAQRML